MRTIGQIQILSVQKLLLEFGHIIIDKQNLLMSTGSQGIDHSLNLLKQLQIKLKNTHHKTLTQEHISAPRPTTHQRHETQYSIPTVHVQNQNQYKNIQEIIRQNRRLKKYVNCLLEMNDCLKNQLIRQNNYEQRKQVENYQNPEVQLLRMEIDYLKEINRDKELQLKKTLMTHQKPQKHSRISSCCDRLSHPKSSFIDMSLKNHHIFKSNSHKKPKTQGKGMKSTQKKNQPKKSMKKCRLCYI